MKFDFQANIFLLTALLLCAIPDAPAQQVLGKELTIDVEDVTLEEFFEILQREHQIVLVYGVDNVPKSLRITIKVSQKRLPFVLDQVCRKTGLTYQVVDNAIWFKWCSKSSNSKSKGGLERVGKPNHDKQHERE